MKISKIRSFHNNIMERMTGHWCALLGFAIPDIYLAVKCLGYPIDCPIHGPGIRFTMHRNGNETGGGSCFKCGDFRDGVELLIRFKGIPFIDAMVFIEEWLERYDNAISTGYPDMIVDERYMSIPLPPHTHKRVNRFNQLGIIPAAAPETEETAALATPMKTTSADDPETTDEIIKPDESSGKKKLLVRRKGDNLFKR